jgi:hypothetical protein
VSLSNAELFKSAPSKASIITFKPGRVSLVFNSQSAAVALPRFNQEADIENHLSTLSARMIEPYVNGFPYKELSLKELSRGVDLAGHDVLVWNHYFLDSLPPSLTPAVVDAIRHHVQQGGGLFLIANAVRLLPPLTGIAMDDLRTNHIGHHLNRVCDYFGVEAAIRDHPIFEGMKPADSVGKCFPLINIGAHDIFKRVLFEVQPHAGHQVKALGLMHVRFKPDTRQVQPLYESSPVVWEYELGKGKVIAYACGVRCCLGSPNRWVPAEGENSVIFVRNILRYLGHQRERILVGIFS